MHHAHAWRASRRSAYTRRVSVGDLVLVAVAGFVAGGINALAGGGSLVLFPVLLSTGMSPLVANVTNTVAAWPGTAGGVLGYVPVLRGRVRRLVPLAVAGGLGSALGCLLLLTLPGSAFDVVVPVLVLAASVLLALQPRLTAWVDARGGGGTAHPDAASGGTAAELGTGEHDASPGTTVDPCPGPGASDVRGGRGPRTLLALGAAGVYGGYFGGAMGVVLLAALSLTTRDDLRRLNADKSALSLVDCSVGVLAFALFGPVQWAAVLVAAPTGLAGGYLGARVARRVDERVLRVVVVAVGVAVAAWLAVR